MIIKNVIAKSLRSELAKALAGKKFSLMIDELTAAGTIKLLSVCARNEAF